MTRPCDATTPHGWQRSEEKFMTVRPGVIAAFIVLLAACGPIDSLKEGFAHSQAVSNQLEKSVGLKSFVGFNWSNGVLTSVNVTFQGLPAQANLADIADKSKRAIVEEFKQTPRQVVIAFAIEP
jgi:hypothetical protein